MEAHVVGKDQHADDLVAFDERKMLCPRADVLPGRISESMLAVNPGETCTPSRRQVENPVNVSVTVYVPGGRLTIR